MILRSNRIVQNSENLSQNMEGSEKLPENMGDSENMPNGQDLLDSGVNNFLTENNENRGEQIDNEEKEEGRRQEQERLENGEIGKSQGPGHKQPENLEDEEELENTINKQNGEIDNSQEGEETGNTVNEQNEGQEKEIENENSKKTDAVQIPDMTELMKMIQTMMMTQNARLEQNAEILSARLEQNLSLKLEQSEKKAEKNAAEAKQNAVEAKKDMKNLREDLNENVKQVTENLNANLTAEIKKNAEEAKVEVKNLRVELEKRITEVKENTEKLGARLEKKFGESLVTLEAKLDAKILKNTAEAKKDANDARLKIDKLESKIDRNVQETTVIVENLGEKVNSINAEVNERIVNSVAAVEQRLVNQLSTELSIQTTSVRTEIDKVSDEVGQVKNITSVLEGRMKGISERITESNGHIAIEMGNNKSEVESRIDEVEKALELASNKLRREIIEEVNSQIVPPVDSSEVKKILEIFESQVNNRLKEKVDNDLSLDRVINSTSNNEDHVKINSETESVEKVATTTEIVNETADNSNELNRGHVVKVMNVNESDMSSATVMSGSTQNKQNNQWNNGTIDRPEGILGNSEGIDITVIPSRGDEETKFNNLCLPQNMLADLTSPTFNPEDTGSNPVKSIEEVSSRITYPVKCTEVKEIARSSKRQANKILTNIGINQMKLIQEMNDRIKSVTERFNEVSNCNMETINILQSVVRKQVFNRYDYDMNCVAMMASNNLNYQWGINDKIEQGNCYHNRRKMGIIFKINVQRGIVNFHVEINAIVVESREAGSIPAQYTAKPEVHSERKQMIEGSRLWTVFDPGGRRMKSLIQEPAC